MQVISKKSIVAYGLPMFIWFIVFIIVLGDSLLYAIPIALIGVYIFLYIRSHALFIDDEGVWVFRGVFSWQKGIYGIKWDDFGEALFYQNITSWLLKSYTIKIKNRFRSEHEIVLTHMYLGDFAVTKINSVFMKKYRKK